MKKAFMFLWKLPRTIFNKINECEENFLKQFDENYTSKLAKNTIIYNIILMVMLCVISPLLITLYGILICEQFGISYNQVVGIVIYIAPSLIFTALYCWSYLKKRLPMIQGRKWWYCIQAILGLLFGFSVIMAPIYILGFLLVAAFYVVIAIIVIWFVATVAFGAIGGGGNGSGRRKWRLDNGDEVTEWKGFLGDKLYTGMGGKEYETDDDGKTFREK